MPCRRLPRLGAYVPARRDADDDVTVEGDVVEVRHRDRLIDLVVRNRLSADEEGGTVLDVDANLRLLGLARVVGGVFHRRVRRTLERALDRLPTAMEQALELDQAESDGDGGEAYGHGIVDGGDPPWRRSHERRTSTPTTTRSATTRRRPRGPRRRRTASSRRTSGFPKDRGDGREGGHRGGRGGRCGRRREARRQGGGPHLRR